MPAATDHYIYHDDAADYRAAAKTTDTNREKIQAQARTTAITTLVLVALVAVLMGVLLFRGIDLIRESTL